MHAEQYREIVAPYAWKGADLQHSTQWIRRFSTEELAEIDRALQAVKARGLDWTQITREDFPLPRFSIELANIAQALETGRGMILLRGLPLEYSPEELRAAYWGIGTHLGTAVSQGGRGELLGVVEDEGKQVEITKKRGSKTADALPFHSDRCDVVGLLCVRKAKSGGLSRIASAAQIHNEVLRRRPDLIDVFYADWYNSRQGDERPGESRAYPKPIFGFRDGHFTGLFSPAYIRSAQHFPEVPRLTQRQEEALTLFGALTDELVLDMSFEPGDIQLLNNHLIYHARSNYEDWPEPDRKRLLLRLWLSVPGSRPLPPGYELLFGNTDAGALRGGVPCRDGWRYVTEWRARRTGNAPSSGEAVRGLG
ncbi:MAG TPA: TauD/TfdA family dioxygenase [Burkholderiales bacterium]|nr:TauD/TfdA family dioxygenase [Burkholderiales bacterium]